MAKKAEYAEAEANVADVKVQTCDVCGKPAGHQMRQHYSHMVCSTACAIVHDELCFCMPENSPEVHQRILQYRKSRTI